MKLAVTAREGRMDAPLDPRFGRAPYFMVVDTATGAFSAVDNSINLNAAQGAGIQSGKRVVDLGAAGVVTGHVGPKAFSTLRAGGVEVYTGACGTVAEAVEQFKAGKLTKLEAADVEGHWS